MWGAFLLLTGLLMADDERDFLEKVYGPNSKATSDVHGLIPERDRWAGAFSSTGKMPSLIDLLRARQGGMLTPEQIQEGLGEPHKDVLSGLFPQGQQAAGAVLGAIPDEAWLASAFLGVGPKTPPRALKALEKAKEIAASETGTPGQRTEKAWKAGGQSGGWDQLPTHAGETDWMRYVPTFDPGKPPITAYEGRPSVYDNKGWFGRHKTDKQTGTVGELTNLNPALLKEFPEIADIPLTLKRGYNEDTGGYLRPGGWFSKEKIGVSGYNDNRMAESLAHELQHVLSRRQDWSRGSDPSAEKRPWIAHGNDMKHYGDTAFDRYQKVVGEQMAELDAKMHANERYGKHEWPASFPSYESGGPKGRGIERSTEGKRPTEMPPSWQFTSKLKDMRDPTTPMQNVFWHWPADLLKALGVGYGINSLGKLLPDPSPEDRLRKQIPPRSYAPILPNLSSVPGAENGQSMHDEEGFIAAHPPWKKESGSGGTGSW